MSFKQHSNNMLNDVLWHAGACKGMHSSWSTHSIRDVNVHLWRWVQGLWEPSRAGKGSPSCLPIATVKVIIASSKSALLLYLDYSLSCLHPVER